MTQKNSISRGRRLGRGLVQGFRVVEVCLTMVGASGSLTGCLILLCGILYVGFLRDVTSSLVRCMGFLL